MHRVPVAHHLLASNRYFDSELERYVRLQVLAGPRYNRKRATSRVTRVALRVRWPSGRLLWSEGGAPHGKAEVLAHPVKNPAGATRFFLLMFCVAVFELRRGRDSYMAPLSSDVVH